MMEMEKILLTSGWLNHSENKLQSSAADSFMVMENHIMSGKNYWHKTSQDFECPGKHRHKKNGQHSDAGAHVSWLTTPML